MKLYTVSILFQKLLIRKYLGYRIQAVKCAWRWTLFRKKSNLSFKHQLCSPLETHNPRNPKLMPQNEFATMQTHYFHVANSIRSSTFPNGDSHLFEKGRSMN